MISGSLSMLEPRVSPPAPPQEALQWRIESRNDMVVAAMERPVADPDPQVTAAELAYALQLSQQPSLILTEPSVGSQQPRRRWALC